METTGDWTLANVTPDVGDILDEVREWYRHWHTAWEAAAECGACDALGSIEYARMTATARFDRVPAEQTAMRRFIRERAHLPSAPTVTQESLARRSRLTNERGGSSD